jgi:hypothetical protein
MTTLTTLYLLLYEAAFIVRSDKSLVLAGYALAAKCERIRNGAGSLTVKCSRIEVVRAQLAAIDEELAVRENFRDGGGC